MDELKVGESVKMSWCPRSLYREAGGQGAQIGKFMPREFI